MNYLDEYLGTFNYQLVDVGNGNFAIIPDMIWIVKAIILVICCIYFIRGLYGLIGRVVR